MNTAIISMLATAASDAANWGGAANSADSALAPDKTGMPYAHQRFKATALSRPISVPRNPTTISGPWTSTNWLLGIGSSQLIQARPAQSPVRSEIPAKAMRKSLCRFELMLKVL